MSEWTPVVFADDCMDCEMCGEPACGKCHEHYAECACPGPMQEDIYDYKEIDGVLMARRIEGKVVH
jgi:hypothetical protein